ncbi:MAG: dephospho-CoA kinase [Myxococcota bacterium]|nr:dephospho-CoA kinase [Myxococcota bacterium]
MKTVGLTGGIACGKSTVAGLIRRHGTPVIDADVIARDIVAPGTDGLAAVVSRFGDAVLLADGSLHRSLLREIVAADGNARRDLERITHPRIGAAILGWLDAQAQAGTPVAAVEAALMVETGTHTRYDHLLVVACSPGVQLARLMARDGMSELAAARWLGAQLPVETKVELADAVIWNDGPIEALPAAVHAAWAALGFSRR